MFLSRKPSRPSAGTPPQQTSGLSIQIQSLSAHGSAPPEKKIVRQVSSIRDLRQLLFHTIPEKLFKSSNPSETLVAKPGLSVITPTTTPETPDIEMKRARPTTSSTVPIHRPVVQSKDRPATSRADWAPDLSPVSFSPTLSLDMSPKSTISPPTSPPPSRSRNLAGMRRKLSFRNSIQSLAFLPRQPSSSHGPMTPCSPGATHERRRSKYLNDPTVLSMLDRNFEEALHLGFTSPPPTPNKRSPSPIAETKRFSPISPSMDGTTIAEEDEEDIFTRPTPNLALPTLKELDDGEWKDSTGDVMTLRLTLTPATCLTEVEENFALDTSGGLGKGMKSGFGKILGRARSRSRKVRI